MRYVGEDDMRTILGGHVEDVSELSATISTFGMFCGGATGFLVGDLFGPPGAIFGVVIGTAVGAALGLGHHVVDTYFK